MTDTSIYI